MIRIGMLCRIRIKKPFFGESGRFRKIPASTLRSFHRVPNYIEIKEKKNHVG
jgi:hypothetical protein